MRGSPVLRFILLAIALAAAAAGLRRVTSAHVETPSDLPVIVTESPAMRVPFRLMLSAPAAAVEIDTGKLLRPDPTEVPITGNLEMDPKNPRIALVLRWKSPPSVGEHRFAKLTLEPPGQDTFVHVFDADGDIDDFIELPLPAAKHE